MRCMCIYARTQCVLYMYGIFRRRNGIGRRRGCSIIIIPLPAWCGILELGHDHDCVRRGNSRYTRRQRGQDAFCARRANNADGYCCRGWARRNPRTDRIHRNLRVSLNTPQLPPPQASSPPGRLRAHNAYYNDTDATCVYNCVSRYEIGGKRIDLTRMKKTN